MAIDGSAVNVTVCGAFYSVKDDGEARKPDGPEAVTETVPLKPPYGAMDICTVEDVPGAIESADGFAAMVKAAWGGGGLEDPPPQPSRTKESPITRTRARHLAADRRGESILQRLRRCFAVDSISRTNLQNQR